MTGLSRARLADFVVLIGLGVFAFLCTYEAGQRGFFAYDQSIVFDGGYRIVSGQVPYKDFLLWTGPITYILQALFFRWLGVNYAAYLASAGVFNAVAAFLAVALTRLVFPSRRLLSYGAGLVTAIWFYPPFGTFAAEQTAFFFSLAALWLTVWAVRLPPGARLASPALACGAGVLAVVAVLSKQHAGMYMLPLYPFAFLVADGSDHRRLMTHGASFTLGIILSLLALWWWLWAASDAHNFVRYVLTIPGELGWARIFRKGIRGLLKAFLIGVGPRTIRPVVVGMEITSFVAVWMLLRAAKGTRQTVRIEMLACLICAYLTHFQHVLTYTMDNQSINGLPFVGVIVAMGLGLLQSAWPVLQSGWLARAPAAGARIAQAAAIAAVFLSISVPSAVGMRVSFDREAHDLFRQSTFPRRIDVPGWRPLRWGQPTVLHGVEIREADVVRLYRELTARGRNFFIFPDFTIFYGLTGRPSPQPLVTFNKGLTYPARYDPALDAWMVRALEQHQVEIVVLEEVSFRDAGNSREMLREFPKVEAYLKDEFRESGRIGIFTIYEKRALKAEAAHTQRNTS